MSRLLLLAAALLAALSFAAPVTAQGDSPGALVEAVQACRRFVDDGATAAAAFSGTRLASAPTHAALQGAFLKDVRDTAWYSRTLAPGVIRVAASRSVNNCKIFLLGQPGKAAIDKVAAEGFSGWREMASDQATRFFYRRRADDNLAVASLHLGPEAVSQEQIGALVDVYVMPSSK